ncbi:restriction endonuclease subunit S [Bacillus sp. RC]|nr:restriction endonuclease subunit S [Bacillus sp. RC]
MIKYRLGDIVEVISEREDNPSNCKYDKFVGLEHYISGEVEIKNYGNTDLLKSAMKVFNAGDILIARRNVYLKRASIVNFDGITSGDSIVLRAKDELIKKLLPFVLNTDNFWKYAEKFSDGTMSKRLSPRILLEYEFNLPDVKEQKKLAELLWGANNTKEAYKKLFLLTDDLVKSQFIEMFGDPKFNPMNWDTRTIGDITNNFNSYRKPVKSSDREKIRGMYPYYGATGIVDYINEWKLEGRYLLVTEDGKSLEYRNKEIAFFAEGKIWVNNHAHVLQSNEKCSIDYLCFYINLIDISNFVTGIDQKKLTRGNLESIPVMNPPIELQNQFANFIKQADKSKFELQQTILSLESTVKSLMKQYIG